MNEQILVVEDDERLAAVVRDGLAHYGYHVTVVGDGATALTAVRQRPPALVVLDLMLPDLDGMEACRRLRASGGPPVIMLTARDAVTDTIAGLESGADDYVTKPFVLDDSCSTRWSRACGPCSGGTRRAQRRSCAWPTSRSTWRGDGRGEAPVRWNSPPASSSCWTA